MLLIVRPTYQAYHYAAATNNRELHECYILI